MKKEKRQSLWRKKKRWERQRSILQKEINEERESEWVSKTHRCDRSKRKEILLSDSKLAKPKLKSWLLREQERERERDEPPKTCWCSLLEKTLFEYCQTMSTSSSSCTSRRSLFPPTVGWMISDLEWKYGLIWNCNHLYRTSVHEAGGPDGWIIYSIFGLLEKSKFARKH